MSTSAPTTTTGADFVALIGRRVLVVAGASVIGAGGTTTVESVAGDVVILRTGKTIRRPIDARKVETVTALP